MRARRSEPTVGSITAKWMVDGGKEARARSRVIEACMMSPGGMVWVTSTRRAVGAWLSRTAFMAATYQSSRPKSVVRVTIGKLAIEESATNGKIEAWLERVKPPGWSDRHGRCRRTGRSKKRRKRGTRLTTRGSPCIKKKVEEQ